MVVGTANSKEPGPAFFALTVVFGPIGGLVWWISSALRARQAAREAVNAAAFAAAREAEEAQAAAVAQAEAARVQQRWDRLAGRFGIDAAKRIWAHEIWLGQTGDMLVESLGPPFEKDEKIARSKTCHVFKYRPMPGNNRWGLRVDLEDGVVVGWEAKDV